MTFENSEFFLELQAALGRKIRRLREEQDLSQRQLATVAYVSGPHFGLLESGVGNVTLLVLVKLAKALGVSVCGSIPGGGRLESAVDSAIVRLAAAMERVEQHLDRRKDEFARAVDDLKDFMKQYRQLILEEVERRARLRTCALRSPSGRGEDSQKPKLRKADRLLSAGAAKSGARPKGSLKQQWGIAVRESGATAGR